MIHYHGLPITPNAAAVRAISAGHAIISYAHPQQLALAAEYCQSFAIDNGAFSAWRSGNPVQDWSGYYEWTAQCGLLPGCDFAIIPDVIDGSEDDNDALIEEWPHPRWFGAPVWHLHESLDRLERLMSDWHRICLGSSGEYATIGTSHWWHRMHDVMGVVCNEHGQPLVKLHGLRMLDPRIFQQFPFSSVDSTNIGRNINLDTHWRGTYTPPNEEVRAMVMRSRIEAHNAPNTYQRTQRQMELW